MDVNDLIKYKKENKSHNKGKEFSFLHHPQTLLQTSIGLSKTKCGTPLS